MPVHRRLPLPREDPGPRDVGRRRFLGYLLAAPTLTVAAQVSLESIEAQPAHASIPSPPGPSEVFDLGDLQSLAAAPTAHLIRVQVNSDGVASFAVLGQSLPDGVARGIGLHSEYRGAIAALVELDCYFYTREWNTPLEMTVVVLPDTADRPSGAGELAVAPSVAAVACAYTRATGTMNGTDRQDQANR